MLKLVRGSWSSASKAGSDFSFILQKWQLVSDFVSRFWEEGKYERERNFFDHVG